MALEKLFEQTIDQRIRLDTTEEIIADVEEKCARVHSILEKSVLFFGGLLGDVSHYRAPINERLLYANIDKFPNLRELVISKKNQPIDLAKLPKSLEIFSILGKRNLAPLNDLPNLRNLGIMCIDADLEQIPALFDKLRLLSFACAKEESQIGNFTNLETLTFGELHEGCAPIGKLKKLRRLQIETFKPDTLAGLEGCEALTNLRIQNNGGLSDISALAQLKHLRQFTGFFMFQVTDLTPLAELPLEVLEMPACGATDFSPLAGLKSLKKLVLSECLLDDLSFLEGMENLEEIDLCNVAANLIDYSGFFDPLLKLPKLKQVSVENWVQEKFPPELRHKLGLPPLHNSSNDADLDDFLRSVKS